MHAVTNIIILTDIVAMVALKKCVISNHSALYVLHYRHRDHRCLNPDIHASYHDGDAN